jgi:hypothetical protein
MRQWWTNSTVEEYVNRTACFIEQYSNYRLEEIDGWVRPQYHHYHGFEPSGCIKSGLL